MRRLAFYVQVPGFGWVVFAAPRLNKHKAIWLASFTNESDGHNEHCARQYAERVNELAETFMPPKRKG